MAEKVTIEVDAEVKKALDNLEKIKQKEQCELNN